MPLHAKSVFNDPASIPGRAYQLSTSLEGIRGQTNLLIQLCQPDAATPVNSTLTYVLLAQIAERIRSSRNHISGANGVGFGDIKSTDVRQFLADHDSVSYNSAGQVGSLLNGLDAALVSMNAAYRALIANREGQAGGAIATDSGTELIQDAPFTVVEVAPLLAEAQTVVGLIDPTTYINGVPA